MLRRTAGRLAGLIAAVHKLLAATFRLEIRGLQAIQDLPTEQRLVFVLWHDEILSAVCLWPLVRRRVAAVVSQSQDGDIMAGVLESWGMATVRGSSHRGGLRALLSLRRLMDREGIDAAVVVDGPKGPRHEVKDGALYLAERSDGLIVPIRARPERAYLFRKAWDKFQLPWPFTRIVLAMGEPYAVADISEAGLDRERQRLKERMEGLLGDAPPLK